MPFDVVAFYESIQNTTAAKIAPIADTAYEVNATDKYIKVQPEASYLLGLLNLAVTTPRYAQIRQPSMLNFPTFYRAGLTTDANHSNGLTWLAPYPLALTPNEKLSVYTQNASNEVNAVALFLGSGRITTNMKESIAPTHKLTGYVDSALTAGIWNSLTPTWEQDLPQGDYAIVGMRALSYLADCRPIVTRLNLQPKTTWRPGVVTSESAGDKTIDNLDVSFRPDQIWGLMPEISFNPTVKMPSIEMLSATADTDHVIDLLLQKIG